MPDAVQVIEDVEELVRVVQPVEAQQRLSTLIRSLDRVQLLLFEGQLRRTIAEFTKARARELTQILDASLSGSAGSARQEDVAQAPSVGAVEQAQGKLRQRLAALSRYRIFQWADYRNLVEELIQDVVEHDQEEFDLAPHEAFAVGLAEEFSAHVREVFHKGFEYFLQSGTTDSSVVTVAQEKAVRGLGSLLEAVSFSYRAAATLYGDPLAAEQARLVIGPMLSGTIEGFASLDLGGVSGSRLLRERLAVWTPALAYLTPVQLESLSACRLFDDIADAERSVKVMVSAMDAGLREARRENVLAVAESRMDVEEARLDVSLVIGNMSGDPIRTSCYMMGVRGGRQSLEILRNQGTILAVASLSARLAEEVSVSRLLADVVVDVSLEASPQLLNAKQQAVSAVIQALQARGGKTGVSVTLLENVAQEFPVTDVVASALTRVSRPSVERLFRGGVETNGVRLWCSVRRSGKTTACFGPELQSRGSVVLRQTCLKTEQYPEANVLFEGILSHILAGDSLPRDFVRSFIDQQLELLPGSRAVLVIDEYEILFRNLVVYSNESGAALTRLVLPLLEQLVAFARDNLLMLVGQRPDAHRIAVEHNQLSVYTHAEHFPLFEHARGATVSEYSLLMSKVFRHLDVEPGFVDRMYGETGGHPYLSVYLARAYLDWASQHMRESGKILGTSSYAEFAYLNLARRQLARESARYEGYGYFIDTIGKHLSPSGPDFVPWLYCVYSVLRRIALESPQELQCSYDDYAAICEDIGSAARFGKNPDVLLAEAEQSNFLFESDGMVRPAVPLIARLAAIAAPITTAGR